MTLPKVLSHVQSRGHDPLPGATDLSDPHYIYGVRICNSNRQNLLPNSMHTGLMTQQECMADLKRPQPQPLTVLGPHYPAGVNRGHGRLCTCIQSHPRPLSSGQSVPQAQTVL